MPDRASPYPEWVEQLPTSGHFVYHLAAPVPGRTTEESVAHVYIGVTSALRQRMRAHARKWWFAAVAHDLLYLEEHPSRQAANRAEAELIRMFQPAMNRAGRLLVVG